MFLDEQDRKRILLREGGAVVCDQSGDDDGLRLVGHGDADGERGAHRGEEGDMKGVGHEVGSGPARRLQLASQHTHLGQRRRAGWADRAILEAGTRIGVDGASVALGA